MNSVKRCLTCLMTLVACLVIHEATIAQQYEAAVAVPTELEHLMVNNIVTGLYEWIDCNTVTLRVRLMAEAKTYMTVPNHTNIGSYPLRNKPVAFHIQREDGTQLDSILAVTDSEGWATDTAWNLPVASCENPPCWEMYYFWAKYHGGNAGYAGNCPILYAPCTSDIDSMLLSDTSVFTPPPPPPPEESVDWHGGIFSHPSGTVVFYPQGAIVDDTMIASVDVVIDMPPPYGIPPNNEPVSYARDLGEDGYVFQRNVLCVVPYESSEIWNIGEESQQMFIYDPYVPVWIPFTDYTIDPVNHTMTFSTDHFTIFGSAGEPDTDGDNVSNDDEINIHNTNPDLFDADGDGLGDGEELIIYHSNPTNADTDGDGFDDGEEALAESDPSNSFHTPDCTPVFSDAFSDCDIGNWDVYVSDGTFESTDQLYLSYECAVHMSSQGSGHAYAKSMDIGLDASQDYNIVFHFQVPSSNNHWFLVMDNLHVQLAIDYGTDLVAYQGSAGGVLPLKTLQIGQWYYIACRVRPGIQKYDVFVGSDLLGTANFLTATATPYLRIGDIHDGSYDHGEGCWDDISVYGVSSFQRGDADGSGTIDIDDAVYLVNYIFAEGPPPDPIVAGDADCSGTVDIDDTVYLIAFIFSGGPEPGDPDGDGVPDC